MYSVKSELTKEVCDDIGWDPRINALETMEREGKIYVRGTLLHPAEALELKEYCHRRGYKYTGPF